jgi:serine/tyrosine/threonine adenylyltransferase
VTFPVNEDAAGAERSTSAALAAPALGLEHSFAEQLEGLYVPYEPEGFPKPELIQLNRQLYEELDLPPLSDEQIAAVFSGNVTPRDARPLAQAYAGHQFGAYSPQLGDGRALLLGERIDRHGRRIDLQLKGSGPTPFSRGGDGKAALGPVLRETLVSEAMYRLDVPTTRVLTAITTGEQIFRERPLPGAVLARTAASHLRIGTLEFFAHGPDLDKLERLVSYALERHYPDRVGTPNAATQLLEGVAQAQGALIARWMLLGFIHGVMNTDNMTLSGETIDYGPCAFMEAYDPKAVFSSIDRGGRYAFGNQPDIGRWNLMRMGQALLPLLAPERHAAIEQIRQALDLFHETYEGSVLQGMRNKLGLKGESLEDEPLIADLLDWMHSTQQDYTLTFRRLADGLFAEKAPFADEHFLSWYTRYQARLNGEEPAQVAERMNQVNPLYIPRNHLVEEALGAAVNGDLTPFREMLDVLGSPYIGAAERDRYARPAPPDFGPYRTFCGT